LQSSSGLFLDFSWVAADAEVTEVLPACRQIPQNLTFTLPGTAFVQVS
jgi:hypothetical protein